MFATNLFMVGCADSSCAACGCLYAIASFSNCWCCAAFCLRNAACSALVGVRGCGGDWNSGNSFILFSCFGGDGI